MFEKMEQIKKIIQSSIDVKKAVLENSDLLNTVLSITEIMVAALKSDRRIYFCGNGGRSGKSIRHPLLNRRAFHRGSLKV